MDKPLKLENSLGDFEALTPELIFDAVEAVLDCSLESLLIPLPSYINRVYELKTTEDQSLIVKFYRPGRWSQKALLQEHRFVLQCAHAEIPVIAPMQLSSQSTLAKVDKFSFALYPKKSGRDLNIEDPAIWFRLGSMLGRLHNIGAGETASERIKISPELSFKKDIDFLLHFIDENPWHERFKAVSTDIFNLVNNLFDNIKNIRLHGDLHSGNILFRDQEGMLLIDFDDMSIGPAIQDFWLLLPGPVEECDKILDDFIAGYENFFEFDRKELVLIEALRAMRMIYFLAWCAKQINDPGFYHRFPQWENRSFWAKEIEDLYEQKEKIMQSLNYI